MLKQFSKLNIRNFHYKILNTGFPQTINQVEKNSQCYCQKLNATILSESDDSEKIDINIKLPNKLLEYKKHVLLISPMGKTDSKSPFVWEKGWGSKIEDNTNWPYSTINILKNHLKDKNINSGILINAISVHERNSNHIISNLIREKNNSPITNVAGSNDQTCQFLVIPEMKIYNINKQDLSKFGDFITQEFEAKMPIKLSFDDYLKGNAELILKENKSSPINSYNHFKFTGTSIDSNWIFICGHKERDMRCGIIGKDIARKIEKDNLLANYNVAIISHVGGHKFAGNVILYTNEDQNSTEGSKAVDTLWLGKVTPENITCISNHFTKREIPSEYLRGHTVLKAK
ncbi:hypothetical protein TBLA_0B02060 [Henningerozyma blattae CBS 6284]|uniref:Altered inheritance of mitochondria protein 32 n=1 Tax=Henningerozyma blattae (strain ATCC 34711 / CBS 6284 / DSM 70876 / NBRC 10599 / NRRL Y-10934 / UCD 77-7) TaxID=1071380 RepID=I2GY46_HENB6|nr:hypothetical protein TBLA_0B02060 [Tetrapisispora blattae CBS 6284]CCH59048.1 hypothetical protein TBLA_0B02060 [Tetrapisispora blattae CBS 6284]